MNGPNGDGASGETAPTIEVRNLTMAYGNTVVMHDLNFIVRAGEVFIIMGGSGCGKSTLLRHLIGLQEPAAGDIVYSGVNFTQADADTREAMVRRFGVLYNAILNRRCSDRRRGFPWGETRKRSNVIQFPRRAV